MPASSADPEETKTPPPDDLVLTGLGPAPAVALSLDEAIDRVILALGPGPRPEPPRAERPAIADTLVSARLLAERPDEMPSARRSA